MKTALIGAGVIGRVHAKILASMERSVCAICDTDIEKARTLAAEFYPEARIYADYEELLNCENVDVVHICTPHYLHKEQVISALDKGINVLCEKPLCAHPDELDAVLEAEKRSSAILGVSQQNRYNEATRFALDFMRDNKPVDAHGSVCWHRDEKYFRESPWRGKLYEAGGGSLINQALHTLDLAMLFCGMPSFVTAKIDTLIKRDGVEVEDTVNAFFGGDAKFSFYSTNNCEKNYPAEVKLILEDGRELTVRQKSVLLDCEPIFTDESGSASFGKSYYGNAHGALFAHFYNCIKTGRRFPIDGKEAAKVMKLIFAVYESNGQKTQIK